MLASMLDQVSGLVGDRFKLNALFPALIGAFAIAGLALVATDGVDAGIERWEGMAVIVQGGTVILGFTVVFVIAAILDSQALWLTKAYEGYVGPLRWKPLSRCGRRSHLKRYDAFVARRTGVSRAVNEYPPVPLHRKHEEESDREAELRSEKLLPTRLGNVLRSGESYPHARYGMNAITTWPRLLPLVPERDAKALADSRSAMEQLLILATLAGFLGTVGGVVFAGESWGMSWSLLTFVGGWALAFLCYRGAVDHAISYTIQLKSIFDLHRWKLLDELGIVRPRGASEERRRWDQVDSLLTRSDPGEKGLHWAFSMAASDS